MIEQPSDESSKSSDPIAFVPPPFETQDEWSTSAEPPHYTPEATDWHQNANRFERLFPLVAGFIGLILLMLSCSLGWNAWHEYKNRAQIQLNTAASKAEQLVNDFERLYVKPSEKLVAELQKTVRNDDEDMQRFLQILRSDDYAKLNIVSVGTAYLPYAYDPEQRLKAPFLIRTDTGFTQADASDFYDYTRPAEAGEDYDARWFTGSIGGDGGWQEPYYGKGVQQWLAEYSLPIYKTDPETQERSKIGIVFADLSLEEVSSVIRNLNVDTQTYSYLVSPQGTLVSHPASFLLGKSIIKAYSKANEEIGPKILARIQSEQNFVEEFYDQSTGQSSTVIHRSVPNSGWSFGVVIPTNSLFGLTLHQKKTILLASIVLSFSLLFLLAAVRYAPTDTAEFAWTLSNSLSLLAFISVLVMLSLFTGSDSSTPPQRLFSTTDFLNARQLQGEPVTLIPTGVVIRDIQFTSPQKAKVSGVLWQRFLLNEDKKSSTADTSVPAGVVWPNAWLDSESARPLQSYRAGKYQIQLHRFAVEVPLERNISRFPFDMSSINIKMRALQGTTAELVPDFESYDILIPEAKPGIVDDLDLSHWNIKSSFFTLDSRGSQNISGTLISDPTKRGEIVFSIQLARLSHSPLVSNFFPIFLGTIMMFVVLMIPSDRTPSAVYSTLGYGGTIFFVISMFHVGLRNAEGIDSFTYMESYYILQHCLVVLVSINGYLLMRGSHPRWLQYRNNLVAKVLYWPLLTIILASSTAIYFIPK